MNAISSNSDFFGSKLAKSKWFLSSNQSVKEMIDNDDRLAAFLLEASDNTGDFSLERVNSVTKGNSYLLIGLEVRSKQNNELKKIDQILSIEDTTVLGMGVLVFVTDDKTVYLGFENKKNILSSTEEPRPIVMHFPNFSAGATIALPAKIQKDVEKFLGKKPQVDRFVDLGQVKTNPGSSPDLTSLFALVFEGKTGNDSDLKSLSLIKPKEWAEVAKDSKDPFLLAILSKLSSFAII